MDGFGFNPQYPPGSRIDTVIEMPPCGKPQLTPPEVCDLQRSVFDLRARMELLQQELGKGNMKPQVCRQQVSGIMGRLESLAEDAAILERASAEVQEKARTGLSLAQVMRGLDFLRAGIGDGCKGVLSGLSKIFGHGQMWLASAGQCCGGFTRLLNTLVSGIFWSARGFGYYAGVAMLTPVFLVKKLAEDHESWWPQPLPVEGFPDLPEGMEVYDPLKSTEAFNAMYRYLIERGNDDISVNPETPVVTPVASFPAPSSTAMMPATEFFDSLQIHLESLRDLVRKIRSSVLEYYEKIIDSDASAARKRMHSKLKKLSDDLKQKLSNSGRRADIDRAVVLLESGEWNKEQWLHLNWMCNRYSSMLKNTVFEDYATVNHMARSIGEPMQSQLQAGINAFDLCTNGDVENALQAVWLDWERHHPDSIEKLMADPVLRCIHEGPLSPEKLFSVRAGVLYFARKTCKGLSQGMLRPPSEITPISTDQHRSAPLNVFIRMY